MPMISTEPAEREDFWQVGFAAAFGLFLGLALLKLGHPVVLNEAVERPQSQFEVIFQSWPVEWGYALLVPVALLGAKVARLRLPEPRWVMAMPLVWFGWQLISATHSIRPDLTRATLLHFAACLVCLYLGVFALARVERLRLFWLFLGVAFVIVLKLGFDQHFGGLEETRRFVFEQMKGREIPPEFLKKIQSDRIFSTLVYPNALAGVILLLLPPLIGGLWTSGRDLPAVARAGGCVALGGAAMACLFWTGSKGGWLIAMAMVVVAFFHGPYSRRVKVGIAVAIAVVGLAGFGLRFQKYFEKGATSVGARFDYWRAAWKTALENPIVGTGPGTFSAAYQRVKRPESEMARLTHNDYLEQASDSGFLGAAAFAAFFLGLPGFLYRKSTDAEQRLYFFVWLGCAGWAAQSFVEFGLYLPAIAWPGFALMGWLWGTDGAANQIDSSPPKV